MKRIYLLLMLVISVATVYGQSTEAPYSVTLGEFTQLRIRHGIPVDYVCSNDSSGLITFTGTKELTEALTFDLTTKGKLTISLEPRNFDGKIGRVTVRSRQLVSVENEGDSAVRVLGINSCLYSRQSKLATERYPYATSRRIRLKYQQSSATGL